MFYDLTSKKDFSKDFELKNQTRSFTISISSNIVKGFEKNNNNEFIKFLQKLTNHPTNQQINQLTSKPAI